MSIPSQFIEYLQEKALYEGQKIAKWDLFDRTASGIYFDEMNTYGDYKYLLKNIENSTSKKFLDFDCGPGRNIRNCQGFVGSIDGVTTVHQNIQHSNRYLHFCGYGNINTIYYDTNGYDLSNIPDNSYDCIISSVTMQKIEIYDIRYNILKEFLRILKPGGQISIQMGYGSPSKYFVPYNNNTWEDADENDEVINNNYNDRFQDVFNEVTVNNPSEIQNDLEAIGFINFNYELNPPCSYSTYPQWIYFTAYKIVS